MKTRILILCIVLALLTLVAGSYAEDKNPDPLAENLFAPELILQNQQAINLTADQKTFIRGEIQKAQAKFTDLQFQLQDEMEGLVTLIKQPHTDEDQALAQLEKILKIEREVKRAQISLMIRLKNELTADQRAKLQDIKKSAPGK